MARRLYSCVVAVLSLHGDLETLPDGRHVGGGPCALVQRGRLVHGTCILQRVANAPTPIDPSAPHRLILTGGRSVEVRILKHSLTSCGPEIVRFEGEGQL
jgi:hypothetical protein